MKIRIALLQISARAFDQEFNRQKADMYCRKAKELDADIVLFPEMWNIGYERFDNIVWQRNFDPKKISSSVNKKIKNWYKHAVTFESEFVNHFKNLSRELNLAIAVTFLQKGKDKPFNSVVLIDRHGKIVLNYSKVHTCDFSMEYFCAAGEKFYVCELDTQRGKVKVGAMICFDREFPESARELMLLGAEIILIPNSCEMDSHRTAQLKTRAFENMVGIALSNYPASKCNGRSQAYSPVAYNENEVTCENLLVMGSEDEGIFIAEFDMDAIRKYREGEVWGNAYRKVNAYKSLISKKVSYPFQRNHKQKIK